MNAITHTLEFLTPCFCAGANQSRAEIRAPAIRGQLRWWFRTLGGTAAEEQEVFGGVAGAASASTLFVRVTDVKPGPPWTPPAVNQNSPDSYVWYYASVSANGGRWTQQAAIAPRTVFTLSVIQQRFLRPPLQAQFQIALRCFLQLGAFGLRATRGLGSFVCHDVPFELATLEVLESKGFHCEHRTTSLPDTLAIAREIGSLVKGTRKAENMGAKHPSPFGSSAPRQTSAIYFRPVRSDPKAKDCTLVVFEAPHARVLGPLSDRPRIVGHSPTKLCRPALVQRR